MKMKLSPPLPRSLNLSISSVAFAAAFYLAVVPASFADTSWQGTVNNSWAENGNWSTGFAPPAPAACAIYPGDAAIQKLDLGGPTGRMEVGGRFDFSPGGSGYTFSGIDGSVSGFFIRAGGKVNGLVNKDDSTQTFNVPIKLAGNNGMPGPLAAMTFNAEAGDFVFNGNNNAPAAPWTINLNGAAALTMKTGPGSTISVGTKGPGQIVNTNTGTFSGLIKTGVGKLFLGGTAPNTFIGRNVIQEGTITAGKINALGSGNALKVAGTSTFATGGLDQNIGTLELQGTLTIDMANGSGKVSFADSKDFDWTGFNLIIVNFAIGSSSLQFGTDGTGLTRAQLSAIVFADIGNARGQIDANGMVTPGAASSAPLATPPSTSPSTPPVATTTSPSTPTPTHSVKPINKQPHPTPAYPAYDR
ncbi:hypothetical protein [Pedosphaera parvula]|uniref:Autotransporter-associated beta strand repeat protein n=1 Tax=Pedosphaera parvula (strain Ellin514) TaxID=320771 RepID=B9XPC5_PEDPL|nr:hypothetical protein [Pedosphaera parvula]EEF58265.1 hypothetical protein Cflav_PD0993 [Pedosphaera parvula Ellin514]